MRTISLVAFDWIIPFAFRWKIVSSVGSSIPFLSICTTSEWHFSFQQNGDNAFRVGEKIRRNKKKITLRIAKQT